MKLVTKILAATTASLVCLSLVATISVLAAAPSIAGVEITPDPAYTDTDLVAVPTGWEDGDEDEESYLWQWQKWDEDLADWVDIAGETTDTLANSNFNAGDQLKIICTPFDGTESGTAAEAVITISGGIVTIAPSPAYIDTDLTATPSHWVKLGEDELVFAYQWQQWDEDMADWVDIAGETTDTLLSANFAVGDRYQITCTPDYDGTPGDPVFAEVIIMGGIVEITPDPTYTDTDLVAMPLHWPTPTEGTLTFTYKWYKWDFDLADFTLLAGEESATLASGNFIKRDELKVELTPSVDDVAGTPVEDTAVISNSPPSVTDVVITPDPAATDSTLTATPSGWVDADGDPEGLPVAVAEVGW